MIFFNKEMMMRGNSTGTIVFFIYLIFGLYFINAPFGFIPLPDITNWIAFVAGIFLIFGGIKYLRSSPMGMGYGGY